MSLAASLPKRVDQALVKKMVDKQRMLDAAQIITAGCTKPQINAILRATFQPRPVPYNPIYESLLQMDPKTVITTNYDEFLEKNFEHYSGGQAIHNIARPSGGSNLLNDLRSPVRSIVKMHGCITEQDNIVLDRQSYFAIRQKNQGLFQTITALVTVHTVVFVGYSLSDPDIQLILENVNLFNGAQHPHYALMQKPEHTALKEVMKNTYNVEIVEYPAGNHAVVPSAISDLAEQVLAHRSSTGIA